MKVRAALARSASFAHLLGLPSKPKAEDPKEPKGSSAEDDNEERKQRDDESDEDYAKRMEELDKKEEQDEEGKRRAEEEREKEGDDESDEEEMRGNTPAAAARRRERARCKAIFVAALEAAPSSVKAAVASAGAFAFDTLLPRGEAVALMQATASTAPRGRASLDARMQDVQVPNAGPGGPEAPRLSAAAASAAAIIAAGKKARGEQ